MGGTNITEWLAVPAVHTIVGRYSELRTKYEGLGESEGISFPGRTGKSLLDSIAGIDSTGASYLACALRFHRPVEL